MAYIYIWPDELALLPDQVGPICLSRDRDRDLDLDLDRCCIDMYKCVCVASRPGELDVYFSIYRYVDLDLDRCYMVSPICLYIEIAIYIQI